MARTVKVKKKCCKSGPRCKQCPAAYKRLANAGYAERTGKRTYLVLEKVPKRAMKAARVR